MTNSKSAINKELILKLAKQSELVKYDSDSKLAEVEKFAELIIAECSEAIIKDSRLSDVKIAAKCCVRAIKEHFGVEE